MLKFHHIAVITCCLVLSPYAAAQEIPQSEVTKEHGWLDKFVGNWKTESKAVMGEGQPASTLTGKIESKRLGKFWLLTDMTAELGGFSMKGRQTLGFDKATGKYIGTWIDNSSDFMWQYQGSVDETGKILDLEAKGPDMSDPGKMALYRDRYEFVTDDELKLTSSVKGPDGKWIDFMTGVAKRAKK